MGEADPRRLGVHAAISVPGVPDEVPPEYVPRHVDTAEFGVRQAARASQRPAVRTRAKPGGQAADRTYGSADRHVGQLQEPEVAADGRRLKRCYGQ